jgi:hypothetical protein
MSLGASFISPPRNVPQHLPGETAAELDSLLPALLDLAFKGEL